MGLNAAVETNRHAGMAPKYPTQDGERTGTLKVPKREIFVTELFILSDPIWVCDLRTEPKKPFVLSVRLIFTILFLYR